MNRFEAIAWVARWSGFAEAELWASQSARNAAPALIREVRELRERVALMEQSTPARILMTCKKCGHKWMAIWNTEACPKCVFKCECGNSKPYNLRACKTCLDKAALSPDMGEGG